jgi:hypothetical protein
VRAILDSAADICVISPSVIAHFQLVPHSQTSNRTTGGSAPVNVYSVGLILTGPDGTNGPVLVREPHLVMGASQAFSDTVDLIVGLDILLDCLLVLNGPAKTFTLAF